MSATEQAPAHVDLVLTGMTCASCAARIEKKLNRLDGVTATVNFATEKAAIDYDTSRASPDELVAAVEAVGYGATVGRAAAEPLPAAEANEAGELVSLRHRLVGLLVLTVPVV